MLEIVDKLIINKISPNRLYEKGPPKLATIKINHAIEKEGILFKYPLLK